MSQTSKSVDKKGWITTQSWSINVKKKQLTEINLKSLSVFTLLYF